MGTRSSPAVRCFVNWLSCISRGIPSRNSLYFVTNNCPDHGERPLRVLAVVETEPNPGPPPPVKQVSLPLSASGVENWTWLSATPPKFFVYLESFTDALCCHAPLVQQLRATWRRRHSPNCRWSTALPVRSMARAPAAQGSIHPEPPAWAVSPWPSTAPSHRRHRMRRGPEWSRLCQTTTYFPMATPMYEMPSSLGELCKIS